MPPGIRRPIRFIFVFLVGVYAGWQIPFSTTLVSDKGIYKLWQKNAGVGTVFFVAKDK